MILRDNKGAVLNAGGYLQVSDFMFAVHATQPYGYCAVLQPDGDLQFFYCSPANPALGTGPGLSYFSQLTDAPGHVYKDPSFTFDPGSGGNYFAVMQDDGNFCVYRGTDPAHNQGFCWSTNTYGKDTAPYAAVLDSWTPTGSVDSHRSGTMVYEERTGRGTGSQEVHPGI